MWAQHGAGSAVKLTSLAGKLRFRGETSLRLLAPRTPSSRRQVGPPAVLVSTERCAPLLTAVQQHT